MPDQLTPAQSELLRTVTTRPTGDQTPEQAVNLAVDGFRAACQLAGLEPVPSEAAVRKELPTSGDG